MSCDNCKFLEKHIVELKKEVLDLEDRRSRERVRFITEEQRSFFRAIDSTDESDISVSRRDFEDLLGLIKEIVENPNPENLEKVKGRLQGFILE
jgi:hypothetical protein